MHIQLTVKVINPRSLKMMNAKTIRRIHAKIPIGINAGLVINLNYPFINSLEFFINSFNFCRGKRGVFLCTATGGRRGWQRKATGCQGLWRRVSGTAGSCGEPCADGPGCGKLCAGGQPGRLCGRAGALTGFQRGVDNNQQLAGTGDDSGHF